PMPWKTYPMRRRNVVMSAAPAGSPSMRTVPLSGSISRLMNFRVVVLPEPEAPTSATKRPDSTWSVTLWTANVRPSSNDLQSLSSSMNGAMLNWPRARRPKERSFGRGVVYSHVPRDLLVSNIYREVSPRAYSCPASEVRESSQHSLTHIETSNQRHWFP